MADSGFEQTSEAERQLMPPERAQWQVWPWLLLIGVLAVILFVRFGRVAPAPEPRGGHDPAVGKKLARFRLEPLTGDSRQVTEADLDGKVTLVNFWGPWCGPCAVEFPHLVELEEHFRARADFQFFSVPSNQDPRDDQGLREGTEQFLKQHRASFPTYRDPQAETIIELVNSLKLDNFGFPATVLLGSGGVVQGLWIGYVPGDEVAVRQAIEKALAELSKKT
jgi:cytochrome c biogenesis protein CcmG, thiol:disulfide interchange protein DsbE